MPASGIPGSSECTQDDEDEKEAEQDKQKFEEIKAKVVVYW